METNDGRLSGLEFGLESQRRLVDYIAGGARSSTSLRLDAGMSWHERIRRCKEHYVERKRAEPGRAVVWIVRNLDLLTLALCQDLDLPLYLGGRRGPPADADWVWVYSWSESTAYCANLLCGVELREGTAHALDGRCGQVRYCNNETCIRLGAALHEAHCSRAPDAGCTSYFMRQFEFAEGDDLLDVEDYALQLLQEEPAEEQPTEPAPDGV